MQNIFSLIMFLASSAYLSIAFSYDFFSRGIPGGGFFPVIIGIALVLLTGYDLVKNFKENRESKQTYNRGFMIDMVYIIILSLIYVFLFNILGAILSTFVLILGVLFYLSRSKWILNIVISISVPLIIFLMFEVFLNTGLPKGIFENWT